MRIRKARRAHDDETSRIQMADHVDSLDTTALATVDDAHTDTLSGITGPQTDVLDVAPTTAVPTEVAAPPVPAPATPTVVGTGSVATPDLASASGATSAAPIPRSASPTSAVRPASGLPQVGVGSGDGGVKAGAAGETGAAPGRSQHVGTVGRVVLVVALLGVVVLLVTTLGRGSPDNGPNVADQSNDVPALQVDPAPVQLGSVGQPVGAGTDAALPGGLLGGLPGALPGGLAGAGLPQAAPRPGAPPAAAPGAAGAMASLVTWSQQLAGATDIPPRALQAYGLADLIMRRVAPGCHLSWVTVAGLGRIESNHGRFRGSTVMPDGDVNPPITGVPLDGTNGNTTIFDGGGSYAQAMGPMQFIPSTWQRWGTDTHGTGRADINNIDDAAVTAGRYLCAAGGDLATGSGWRQAVLAYNASDEYGRRVYAAAAAYARRQAP